MKIPITDDQECKLYVNATMFPGTRMATIVCEEYVSGLLNEENHVVLLTRSEIEGVINALQKTLDTWDERNGLS